MAEVRKLEHFELTETENKVLRKALEMMRQIATDSMHGKVFIEIEKFKVIVKQSINRQFEA